MSQPITINNFNIPHNIFQTWHTKKLPPQMFSTISNIKKLNPRFNHYLFDDNDCREFIKNNFDESILNAYDRLIPGAYKADLWRYCILYKKGGIYLDIKYKPTDGFKFVHLLDKEYFVLDNDRIGIYNALMICKPGNTILLKAINEISENVKNKFYGKTFLEPTGPHLLFKYFSESEIQTIVLKHIATGNKDYDRIIKYNDTVILNCYPGYFIERYNYSLKKHYSQLWTERNIYA